MDTQPTDPAAAPPDDAPAADNPALTDLLDRLSRQPDFPSMAGMLPDVRRLARCDRARVQALSAALLKDIGLSHRLLRLVNAAYYRSVGAGSIATVTRAVTVMGFEAIGRLSVGARLVESAARGGSALLLREECLRALLAATLADLLSPGRCLAEDAYLAALFRNVGRLLVALHRPVEAQAVRDGIDGDAWPRSALEEIGSRRVLGSGYSTIGRQVAAQWGWPVLLRDAMLRSALDGSAPARGAFDAAALAALCDDLADAVLYRDAETAKAGCAALVSGKAGAPSVRELEAAIEQARLQLGELAQALDLPLNRLPAWGRGKPTEAAADPIDELPAALSAPALPRSAAPLRGAELLSVAIQDLSATLLGGAEAQESAPAVVLESLWRGLEARRAVICLRQGNTGPLVGAFSLEHDGPGTWHEAFRIDPDAPNELFAMLCRRGADTMIENPADPRIAGRLLPWFREQHDAQRFLVLPMRARGEPVGLIYLDGRRDDDLRPDDQALRLARTLRNQLTLALGYGA